MTLGKKVDIKITQYLCCLFYHLSHKKINTLFKMLYKKNSRVHMVFVYEAEVRY